MGKMKDKPIPLAYTPIITARQREVRRFVRMCLTELENQLATATMMKKTSSPSENTDMRDSPIKNSPIGVTEYNVQLQTNIVVNGVIPPATFHDGGGVLTLAQAEDTETPALEHQQNSPQQ